MAERHALAPGDDPPEHAHSAVPPSPLPPAPSSRARLDTMPDGLAAVQWPWSAPAPTDISPPATAWRAIKALSRTERQKDINAEIQKSLEALRETIEAAQAFLASVVKFFRWGGAIVGGLVLTAGAGALLRWLSTLHH